MRSASGLQASRQKPSSRFVAFAVEVAHLLNERRGESWTPVLLRALAAIAVHAESGDVLASRIFAARYLGDSKALGRLRAPLERLLGPLDALGIRDGGSATFLGGSGCVFAAGGVTIEAPAQGVVLVENFAVFEACCWGEERPSALLADTLRALIASGSWVEQEAWLGAR